MRAHTYAHQLCMCRKSAWQVLDLLELPYDCVQWVCASMPDCAVSVCKYVWLCSECVQVCLTVQWVCASMPDCAVCVCEYALWLCAVTVCKYALWLCCECVQVCLTVQWVCASMPCPLTKCWSPAIGRRMWCAQTPPAWWAWKQSYPLRRQ